MMRPLRWLGACLLMAMLAGAFVWRGQEARPLVRTVAVGAFVDVAVDAQTGRAFLVDDAGNSVVVLDTHNGRILRGVKVGAHPDAVAVDARTGRAFVANGDDATLSVLDARSGAVLRTVGIGVASTALAVDEQSRQVFVLVSDPLGHTDYDGIEALDARSGALLHMTLVDTEPHAVAVDGRAGHVVVINGSGSSVSLLDARSYNVLRTMAVGQSPGAIAVDERMSRAFVADNAENRVSILDTRSGTVLRTVAVGESPAAAAVDVSRERVFIATWGATDSGGNFLGPGSVSTFDARSGRVLGTTVVGVAPSALAVDERSGHLLVVNAGGVVRVRDTLSWAPPLLRRWLPFLPPVVSTRTVPGSVMLLDLRNM